MPDAIRCPFCHTAIPVGNPSASRAVCPKCGETVSVQMAAAAGLDEVTVGPTPPSGSPTWFKPALFASCAVSVLILVVGLYWVYSGDPKPPETSPTGGDPATVRPPVSLEGLGYLPGTVQIAGAVRPGPVVLLSEAAKVDPRQRLAEAGIPKPVLDAVDRLGIPLTQIDHLAIGLTLPTDNAFPRAVVALVLTKPLPDEAAWWKGMGTERVSGGDHPRYKATLGGYPVQAVRAKPTVFVFATEAKDLDGLESPRPANGDHLKPHLWDTVVNRLSPASFAWVAAASDGPWVSLPLVQLAAKFAKRDDLLPVFAPGRSCAIGLSLEPDPVLRVAVKTEDHAAVGDWFARQWADEKTEVELGDGWATVTAPCPLTEIPARLGKLIPPGKK